MEMERMRAMETEVSASKDVPTAVVDVDDDNGEDAEVGGTERGEKELWLGSASSMTTTMTFRWA